MSVVESVGTEASEADAADASVLDVAMRALKNLTMAIEQNSVRAHRRAVGKLCVLKARLLENDDLSKDVAQVLVSAGAKVSRAVTFATNDDDAADLGITLSLLFGLVVLCKTCPPASAGELSGLKKTLSDYDAFSYATDRELFVPHHVAAGALLRLWSTPNGVEKTAVARHAAQRFFRSTSSAMFLSRILSASEDDEEDDNAAFCSLGVGAMLEEANPEMQERRLAGIVESAESEVGQQILRDLILSFLLPREVLGARKTLLLPREASKRAGVEHGLLLSQAHDAAMRGASYSFSDDEEVIHKVCALLAGFAMLQLAKLKEADVRIAVPFAGILQIGFLELQPCSETRRLFYDEEMDVWRVYSRDPLAVHARGTGFEGLKTCILELC